MRGNNPPRDRIRTTTGKAGPAKIVRHSVWPITIDGPAGSGKTTVGREAARQLGLFFVDSGWLYRAVTWAAINADIALSNEQMIGNIARNCRIKLTPSADGSATIISVNGADATHEI